MAALEWNAGRWTELDMPEDFFFNPGESVSKHLEMSALFS